MTPVPVPFMTSVGILGLYVHSTSLSEIQAFRIRLLSGHVSLNSYQHPESNMTQTKLFFLKCFHPSVHPISVDDVPTIPQMSNPEIGLSSLISFFSHFTSRSPVPFTLPSKYLSNPFHLFLSLLLLHTFKLL